MTIYLLDMEAKQRKDARLKLWFLKARREKEEEQEQGGGKRHFLKKRKKKKKKKKKPALLAAWSNLLSIYSRWQGTNLFKVDFRKEEEGRGRSRDKRQLERKLGKFGLLLLFFLFFFFVGGREKKYPDANYMWQKELDIEGAQGVLFYTGGISPSNERTKLFE